MRTITIQDKDEIEAIVRSCKTCYLAMSLNNQPYVLPMNFALAGNTVILHCEPKGRMWDTLHANPRVSINWTIGEEIVWQDEHIGCSYRVQSASVVAEGEALPVTDFDEKYEALTQMMQHYSDRTFNFNTPAVKNVGLFKVRIDHMSGKRFGVRVGPGNMAGKSGKDSASTGKPD